jgi:protein phosphatase 1G
VAAARVQDAVNLVDELLKSGLPLADVASAVVDRCLAADPKDSFGVGCDNMTCIVIDFQKRDGE